MEEEEKIVKSEEEWRAILSPEQYWIVRQKGTERPFTGALLHQHATGTYLCVACGERLFSSEHKYDSGSGWPSFWQPIEPENIDEHNDDSLLMRRVEITCHRCGAHLGHVFEDGPAPTGLRYCVNSASLQFREAE